MTRESHLDLPGTPARILVTATATETVVAVAAELDLRSTGRLQERITGELALRPRGLIVDLTRVTFCSARGVGVLTDAARIAAAANIAFLVVACHRAVLRPLRVLGLESELAMADSLAEALERVTAAHQLALEVG